MHKSVSSRLLAIGLALVVGHGRAGGGHTGTSEAIVVERNGDLYAVAVDGSRIEVPVTRTSRVRVCRSPLKRDPDAPPHEEAEVRLALPSNKCGQTLPFCNNRLLRRRRAMRICRTF